MSELPGKDIEKYNPFQDDYRASEELLDLIQKQNRQRLDDSGFTTHFIDALIDAPYLDPHATIVVRQTYGEIRKVYADARQVGPNGKRMNLSRIVGEEMHGLRIPKIPFDDNDLEIAIEQLDALQHMKDMGMIAIDNTLSWAQLVTPRP